MKCKECCQEYPKDDFYKDGICYRCDFAKKLAYTTINKKGCRQCGGEIPHKSWVYCSPGCRIKFFNKKNRDYWSRKIKLPTLEW